MNTCKIGWDSSYMVLDFEQSGNKLFKYSGIESMNFFNTLEHLQKTALRTHFMEGYPYKIIQHQYLEQIDLGQWLHRDMPPEKREVTLLHFTINMNMFFDIVYDELHKFISANRSKPKLIIIGKPLHKAITEGSLPDNRIQLNYPNFYKTIYVPEEEGIIVLGEDII